MPDLAAAVIVPDVTRHADDTLEIVAAVHVRSRLSLRDGDAVTLMLPDAAGGGTRRGDTLRIVTDATPHPACEPGFYWVLPKALGRWIVAQYDRVDGIDWWMFPGYDAGFLWDDLSEIGPRVERRPAPPSAPRGKTRPRRSGRPRE